MEDCSQRILLLICADTFFELQVFEAMVHQLLDIRSCSEKRFSSFENLEIIVLVCLMICVTPVT